MHLYVGRLICAFKGHDYEWRRVNITRKFTAGDRQLWKWRGECRRCDHWTTRIPDELIDALDLDDYPNLRKFIQGDKR